MNQVKENIELNELSNKSNAKSVRRQIEYILNPGSELEITYNKKQYRIKCYAGYDGEKSYAIYENGSWFSRGMNVDKITNKYISLYTFDMMGTRTRYKMALDRIIPGVMSIDEEL